MNCPGPIGRFLATTTLIFANFLILNAQTQIPAGSKITVRMENGINSSSAAANDTFTAVTTKPHVLDGDSIISAGTMVVGRVTKAKPAGHKGKTGTLEVEFESMRFLNGTERRITAELTRPFVKKKTGVFNALAIIGGAAAGGIIGFITKSSNGAGIGAGIGAGVGTGIALSRKGKNVGIKLDQEFEIEFKKAVTLPAEGY